MNPTPSDTYAAPLLRPTAGVNGLNMMELKEKIKAEFLPENENKEKGRSNLWCNEHICAYCGKVFIGTSQWVYRTRRKSRPRVGHQLILYHL